MLNKSNGNDSVRQVLDVLTKKKTIKTDVLRRRMRSRPSRNYAYRRRRSANALTIKGWRPVVPSQKAVSL